MGKNLWCHNLPLPANHMWHEAQRERGTALANFLQARLAIMQATCASAGAGARSISMNKAIQRHCHRSGLVDRPDECAARKARLKPHHETGRTT
jgi:hypothetical protein